MVLESTMICFDNSNYQRNGDYLPSRLLVQKEAANLIAQTKLRRNLENNIGLMTIANTVHVLATLTNEMRTIYAKMHDIDIKGDINLLTGIRIAQLALKHRHGRNHKMRIVVFIGSPLQDIGGELLLLAKRLKKEKVNVDIVNFGGYDENNVMLTAFIETLNGKDGSGSTFLNIPRGAELTHALITSPIIRGEGNGEVDGINNIDFDTGLDPNIDPDLALALRISLEEQHQREREATNASQPNPGAAAAAVTAATATSTTPTATPGPGQVVDFANMTEEEQIAYVIQMSMNDGQNQRPNESAAVEVNNNNNDAVLLQNVLENLPGVDAESECVREAVDSIENKTTDKTIKKDDTEKK